MDKKSKIKLINKNHQEIIQLKTSKEFINMNKKVADNKKEENK